MLQDLLNEDTIQVGVDVSSWQEAVERAGEILVNSGGVEPRYIGAMVRMAEELGPYMVVAPGIALPHARPDGGVRRVCVAMVKLRHPISFGHPEYDPVDLVLAFGATNGNKHVEVIAEIADFLMGEALLRVRKARTPGEVAEIVRSEQRKG